MFGNYIETIGRQWTYSGILIPKTLDKEMATNTTDEKGLNLKVIFEAEWNGAVFCQWPLYNPSGKMDVNENLFIVLHV